MAHDHLRNSLPSTCGPDPRALDQGGAEGLSSLLKISSSSQGLRFALAFLSNRIKWQGGTLRPTAPRAPKAGKLSPKEMPTCIKESGGGRIKDEEMAPGNMTSSWPAGLPGLGGVSFSSGAVSQGKLLQ